MVQKHEDTAQAASNFNNEVRFEHEATAASAANISGQFKEMAKTLRGPGQASKSNLDALKEKIRYNKPVVGYKKPLNNCKSNVICTEWNHN